MWASDKKINAVAKLIESGVSADYILLEVLHKIPLIDLIRIQAAHTELTLKAQKAASSIEAIHIKTKMTASFTKRPA